jgi:hypothetical protein
MFTLLIGASLLSTAGCAGVRDQGVVCSELATPAGRAVIVQSGPVGGKPIIRKRVGPGYSMLEQDSGGNTAIVIQSSPSGE